MTYALKRPLLAAGLSMFGGVLACEAVNTVTNGGSAYVLILAAFCLCVCICFAVIYAAKSRREIFLLLALIFGASCFSIFRWSAEELPSQAIKDEYIGTSLTMTVTVTEEPEPASTGYLCKVKPIGDSPFDNKILLYVYASDGVDIYDTITGTFQFSEPYNASRLRADGIILFARLDRKAAYTVSPPTKYPPQYLITNLRRYIRKISERAFGEYSSVTESLLLGGTDTLNDKQYTTLKEAGLLHITCVSGLHIGIFITALTMFFSLFKHKWLTVSATSAAVFLLLCVCGFSPSSVRAALTAMTLLIYKGSGRRPDSLNLLGLPLCLLLAVNPYYAVNVSFLLSFSAVFGILLFYDRVHTNLITRYTAEAAAIPGKFIKWIIGMFSVSLVCTVAVIPVSLIFFGTASAGAVFSGVVCLWAVTPIYIGVLLTVLLYPLLPYLSYITYPLIYAVKKGVSFIMITASCLSASGISSFNLNQFSFESIDKNFAFWLAVFVIAVFILLVFRPFKRKTDSGGKTGKPGLFFILLLAFGVLAGIYFIRYIKEKDKESDKSLTAGFVDVGQGACDILIQGSETAVIDCGGTNSPTDKALEFIYKYGGDDIDILILTHLHDDHVNGVANLLDRISVDSLYIPYTNGDEYYFNQISEAAEAHGIKIITLSDDITLSLGEVSLNIYTDHLFKDADENDNSLVIRAAYGDISFLYTGDLTETGESAFVAAYPDVTATVLSVPHHGSATSSSESFLESVKPTLSVISVSAKNTYGHPAPAAVNRLAAFGKVLTTAEKGCIYIKTDGKGYTVYCENE